MTMPTAPIRTPAGEDELRHRTRKLGQRHRTILLLIDGRRPLEELLSLAQQAGAAATHFEELVRLGLVELPADSTASEASPTADDAAETQAPSSPDLSAGEAPDMQEGDVLPMIPIADPPPAGVAAQPATPQAVTAEAAAPPERVEAAAPAHETPEEQLLQQVRDLLVDTLSIDSPLFGARTFLRVRSAQSTGELIGLVWEIENHFAHARHSRKDLLSLQRARELLGMGNTRVADDTQSGVLPE